MASCQSNAAQVAALALAAGLLALLAAPATAATGPTAHRSRPVLADGHGLHVISETQPDNRQLEVRVSTSALAGPAGIRILLPAGYENKPRRRYPVLYLLPGAFDNESGWVVAGGAETTTAGLPLIVVMPAIAVGHGGGGSCTNWVNSGAAGPQEWETFHIHQLIPWVDQNLRTAATRDGRAIGGASEGGYCAMTYGARHPDLFATALTFSGVADVAYDKQGEALSQALVSLAAASVGGTSNSVFGDPVTDQINWENHDPATLANNLRDSNVLMFNGNGQAGPYDTKPTVDPLETSIENDLRLFHNRLDALRIPSYWDDYGPGHHLWRYFARDLRWSIGTIMSDFAHPPPSQARITYTIADPSYEAYGWQVAIHRTATEFSTLKDAGSDGFTLAGSGSGSVITPPHYTRNARFVVVLRGDNVDQTHAVNADRTGRLHIDVPLGPSNPYQQDTAAGIAFGTRVYTTQVQILSGACPGYRTWSRAPGGTTHVLPDCPLKRHRR